MTSVLLDIKQQVATVTLNRPDVRHALNPELIEALISTLHELEKNDAVRVVVLTGSGTSFCAGADLTHMQDAGKLSLEENIGDATRLAELMHVLNALSKPTVAKINGHVFGGGVGLICCVDIAIAVDDALICLSEVRLGLTPSVISPFVVAAIGVRQARRYFLTAEKLSGHKACDVGFIHESVPRNELDTSVNAIVEKLLKGGPEAMQNAKALALSYSYTGSELDALKSSTATAMGEQRKTPEGQEGFAAFLEKRLPAWCDNKDPS